MTKITSAEVLAWIREQVPCVAPRTAGMVLTEQTELVDIDIDSLETLVLFGQAERRFGFVLSEDAFPRLITVGDVIAAMLQAIRDQAGPGRIGREAGSWG